MRRDLTFIYTNPWWLFIYHVSFHFPCRLDLVKIIFFYFILFSIILFKPTLHNIQTMKPIHNITRLDTYIRWPTMSRHGYNKTSSSYIIIDIIKAHNTCFHHIPTWDISSAHMVPHRGLLLLSMVMHWSLEHSSILQGKVGCHIIDHSLTG